MRRQLLLRTTSCHDSAAADLVHEAGGGEGGAMGTCHEATRDRPNLRQRWRPTPTPDCGSKGLAGSMGALPLVSMGSLPFPLITFAKEAASEATEGRPRAGDLPSEKEGSKRSQSESSSPDAVERGENSAASGLRGGLGCNRQVWRRWRVVPATSRRGRANERERERESEPSLILPH
jgi:hypothetical protein